MNIESDEDYRNRLIECDGVGPMWAEEIGDASGIELDAIGEHFDCARYGNEKKEMKIILPYNETMGFTGGAEDTPIVTVGMYVAPGSMNHGEKHFIIKQNGQTIRLSPDTMQAILKWGCEE
jgi:hypothetical protein